MQSHVWDGHCGWISSSIVNPGIALGKIYGKPSTLAGIDFTHGLGCSFRSAEVSRHKSRHELLDDARPGRLRDGNYFRPGRHPVPSRSHRDEFRKSRVAFRDFFHRGFDAFDIGSRGHVDTRTRMREYHPLDRCRCGEEIDRVGPGSAFLQFRRYRPRFGTGESDLNPETRKRNKSRLRLVNGRGCLGRVALYETREAVIFRQQRPQVVEEHHGAGMLFVRGDLGEVEKLGRTHEVEITQRAQTSGDFSE